MIKHNITATDYTGIYFGCKCKLETNNEKKQGYCEECWERYTDEMDVIYGNGVQK